jgi:hypothetical protein
MKPAVQGVDWSQLWYPGPTRRFTADELQRAGAAQPSATFWMVALVNAVALSVGPVLAAPTGLRWPLAAVLAVAIALTAAMAQSLWRHPTRRRLTGFMLAWGVLGFAFAIALERSRIVSFEEGLWLVCGSLIALMAATVSLWMLTLYRAHQIEARLRELAERDEALAMARRLSAAQLQPHFLFNTLASIQHWVDTGDARAAGTLRALTDYLRALLPLFEQALHPLADELTAMRRYLDIMQARLGPRLQVAFELDPAADGARLPPGLGLTLLENAVEHGVIPSLHGAQLQVRTRREAGMAVLEVQDTGPGFALPLQEGVGLRNCRARLAQAFGPRATLTLLVPPDGPGCLARVTIPLP